MERITENNCIALWGSNYAEVTRWLGRLQRKGGSCFELYKFCMWAHKSPTELLALKDNPASREAEQLLDDFVTADTPEFTHSLKVNAVTATKSFFKYNYRDLARASGAITLIQQKEHRKPKKADLRKLWSYARNLRDKSLITFVNSTALAKGTMAELKLKYFEEGWEQQELPCINCPPEILKGHGIGRYRGVRQITFMTPEAKRDFLNYREWIEGKMGRRLGLEDKIWRNIRSPCEPLDYHHLGQLIIYISKNAGVTYSWHDGRRLVETALEEVGIHPNWARKIRGRKVKGEEAPYSQPEVEKLRAKFREALPLLQFTVEEKGGDRDKLATLITLAKGLGFTQDELTALFQQQKANTVPQQIVVVEKVIESKGFADKVTSTQTFTKKVVKKDCADGEKCQKVVCEHELETLLNDGWHVVTALPSGKIIVSNEQEVT